MNYSNFIKTIANSARADWLYDDDFGRYVYEKDIRFSIVNDREFDRKFEEKWVERFSDVTAHANRFNMMFNASVVETFYAAAVDGYRVLIPYPEISKMSISLGQYYIGRILNIPYCNKNEYDSYF
ncbi:hypothetical protein MUO14_09545 [Halobacillus shinanisalinarum]|uniref:Uncharacterized protein n=1 Tax=Halobacillus shinanisalinarum TaxID=2932258 RepID=A0ABY4H3W1_9BACI|nr:hypothetical protein [Halobacillus shinanisalinarum]UOQ95140.1 hypothetical protein MUO14_09545 [Halobacillus shinanisalinarum]